MTTLTKRFELTASPGKVFSIVSVPERWPQWMPSVKRASSSGSKVHWIYGMGPAKVESNTVITEKRENRVFEFRQTDGWFKSAETRLEIEPTGTGSRVTWTVKYELPYSALGRIADRLQATQQMQDLMNKAADNLQELSARPERL